MFRYLNKNRAQIISEYVIILFVVVAATVSMSVFIKRALQARVKDANDRMFEAVEETLSGPEYSVWVPRQYEPYYAESVQDVQRNAMEETRLSSGGTTGTFNKYINETVAVRGRSRQLPPGEAR